MTLQRLKLIEVRDEGITVTEFDSYKEIGEYARGKTGAISSPAEEEEEKEGEKKSEPGSKKRKKKKLIKNKLQEKIQEKAENTKDSLDANESSDNNENSPESSVAKAKEDKKSFWDKLK